MKTYFLGDLHGNNYALEAGPRLLDQVGAERIVCLGDLVGWLPFGNRTLERMRGLGLPTVAGNHDLLVAEVFADDPNLARILHSFFPDLKSSSWFRFPCIAGIILGVDGHGDQTSAECSVLNLEFFGWISKDS